MGRVYDGIAGHLRELIERQHMFFVATAPLAAKGHVNLSPKGRDSFRVLGKQSVAYLDLVGSGAETIAHVRENGRVTFMFCTFEGAPKIVRIYGRGEILEPGDADFDSLRHRFPDHAATRAIVHARVIRVADSCGYGVPLFTYAGARSQLDDWADREGRDGLCAYQLEHNTTSLDGLPALRGATLAEEG